MIQKSSTSVFQVHEGHPYAKNYNEAADPQSLLMACVDDGERIKQLVTLYNDTILYGTDEAKGAAGWLIDIIQKDLNTLLNALSSAQREVS